MATAEPPGLMPRLAAAMRGEVAATTVEAYRRAGAAAYQDLADAEQLRADLAVSGGSMWTARPDQQPAAVRLERVRAADARRRAVEADYQADPRTVGMLPPSRAEQATAFLGEVAHWSARGPAGPPATRPTTSRPRSPCPRRCPEWAKVRRARGRT